MYDELLRCEADGIINDPSRLLYRELLPSGSHYRLPNINRNIFMKAFVPNAVKVVTESRIRWVRRERFLNSLSPFVVHTLMNLYT